MGRSKLLANALVRIQASCWSYRRRKARTVPTDFNVFEGIGTALHQNRYPPKVFLSTPGAQEFPKVNAVRQAQQSTSDVFYPFIQVE